MGIRYFFLCKAVTVMSLILLAAQSKMLLNIFVFFQKIQAN